MASYVLSYIAEQDIDEVVSYIARENLQAARDFVDKLYDTFDNLAENPFLGHVREDLSIRPSIRFWTFKWHYMIVYKAKTPLEILRMLSGFRDIQHLI